MKNVIVLYAHNDSAFHLANEKWNKPNNQMIGNHCSTDCFNDKREANDKEFMGSTLRERFQTKDGVQYWHFNRKSVMYNTSWAEGEENEKDIRHWIKKLSEKLKSEGNGEKIDAIVAPISMSLNEDMTLINFFKELKEHYPDIKIIVHDPTVSVISHKNEEYRKCIWVENEKDSIYDSATKVVVKRQNDGSVISDDGKDGETYHLQGCVDVVTINKRYEGQYNALRDALELPPITVQTSKGR